MSITVRSKRGYYHTEIGSFAKFEPNSVSFPPGSAELKWNFAPITQSMFESDVQTDHRERPSYVNYRKRLGVRAQYLKNRTQVMPYIKKYAAGRRAASARFSGARRKDGQFKSSTLRRQQTAYTKKYLPAALAKLRAEGRVHPSITALTKPKARQLNSLLAGHTKDTTLILHGYNLSLSAVSSWCNTSSTAVGGTADQATGLLFGDSDNVLINNIHFKGTLYIKQVSGSFVASSRVRMITVWFNKPLLDASAAGTLPPITEVLAGVGSVIFDAPYVTSTSNAGRFTVLSDRSFDLGRRARQINGSGVEYAFDNHGVQEISFDFKIPVKKSVQYKVASTSAVGGGHYDSDLGAGQIRTGLCVTYMIPDLLGSEVTLSMYRRLNYTA